MERCARSISYLGGGFYGRDWHRARAMKWDVEPRVREGRPITSCNLKASRQVFPLESTESTGQSCLFSSFRERRRSLSLDCDVSVCKFIFFCLHNRALVWWSKYLGSRGSEIQQWSRWCHYLKSVFAAITNKTKQKRAPSWIWPWTLFCLFYGHFQRNKCIEFMRGDW